MVTTGGADPCGRGFFVRVAAKEKAQVLLERETRCTRILAGKPHRHWALHLTDLKVPAEIPSSKRLPVDMQQPVVARVHWAMREIWGTVRDGQRCIVGGEGGIRTRGGFYPSHAFQACDLNRSSTSPVSGLYQRVRPKSVAKGPSGPPLGAGGGGSLLCACTIFIAEEISAETSVMLLGTISVVVASLATRL